MNRSHRARAPSASDPTAASRTGWRSTVSWSNWRHGPLRDGALSVVLALACGLASRMEGHELATREFASLVGLSAGIGFAGLALAGSRFWPAVAAGALIANLSLGRPWALACGLAAVSAGEAWLGVIVFRAIRGRDVGFERMRDVLGLSTAAFASALIGAATSAALLLAAGKIGPLDAGLSTLVWWLADAIGIVIIAPLGLAWQRPRLRLEVPRIVEGLLLLGVLLLMVQTLTGQWWRSGPGGNLRPYTMFPIVVWAALRFGTPGIVIANSTLLAFLGYRTNAGIFQAFSPGEQFFRSEAFLAAVTLTDLLLATALAERDRAVAELEQARDGLERSVSLRTSQLERLNEELTREIDERGRAEAKRVQGELLLQESQRMSGVGSWAWDPATDEWELSEELFRIFDWRDRKGAVDLGLFLGHVHPEDRVALRDLLSEHRDATRSFDHEYRIVRADGTQRVLELHVENQTIGGVPRLIGTVQDVTERRRFEDALRRSEERFRSLVDGVRDHAISMLDPSGHVVSWNAGAQRITGFDAAEILGQHFSRFYTARDTNDGDPNRHLLAAERGPVEYEGWRVRKDGSRFWANVIVSPLRDRDGELVGFAKVTRDLTERRRADEELRRAQAQLEARVRERTAELQRANEDLVREIAEREQAEQALERQTLELERSNADLVRFASVASHDLQEPLRTVSEFAQKLATRYRGRLDTDADEYLGFITEGAEWMKALIRDLLAYSKVGRAEHVVQPMSCEDALDQALKNLQHSIESSGAIVTREPLPRIHGNATQITLVFQNLIANSLKFHSQRVPAVHVRAERIGSDWRFSIEDNGIGMEPRHLERIFIMFQRLNSKKKYAGTGVGLAICRRVVELHGGRIWAESGLGKGTTFYFVIPAGARAAEPGPEAKPAPDRALIRSGPAAG